MDLYFVGLDRKFFQILRKVQNTDMELNVLVSMKDMTPALHKMLMDLKSKGIIKKLALDSGTFSLNKSKCDIAPRHLLYRLIEYAKVHAKEYDLIFNFDISFEPDGFDENQKFHNFLSDAGVKTIPVAHDLANSDYKRLADLGHKSIAFGQDKSRSAINLMKANYDLMGQGVSTRHGLGIFNPNVLLFVPFTSVDATTAVKDAANGEVHYLAMIPNSKTFWKKINVTSVNTDIDSKKELMRWISTIDTKITWNNLTGENGYEYRTIINVLFYLEVKKIVDKYHKAVIHYLNTGEILRASMIN